MYKRIILPSIVAVYLLVEAVLGYLMHTTAHFSLFAYSSVVLAFLMNLLFFRPEKRNISTVVALLFTLGADFFLVVLNENYTFAMVLFSVAQLAYAARIYFESGDTLRRVTLFVRGGVAVLSILLPLVILGDGADALAVISVFYFGQLILNCTFAFINSRRGGLILPIGLVLFLACDIFVGFGNLGGYLPIERDTIFWWMAHPPINMAWVFYLPSQALLGISCMTAVKESDKSAL